LALRGNPMATIAKRRCQYCHQWFEPDKRKVDIQMTCMDPACQYRRQRERSDAWWQVTPVKYKDRRTKIRAWATKLKYDRHYRANHPEYAQREAARMKKKRKRLKTVARQISITRIPEEKLWRTLGIEVVSVARQISIGPFFIGERWGDVGVQERYWAARVARQI